MIAEMDVYCHHGVGSASGLAFDEAMALECSRSANPKAMLRLYDYADHCVLLGRFQRLESEVDLDVARSKSISVNRRPTGGGAILMGHDQIGIAFAVPASLFSTARAGFDLFADAVIGGLGSLGVLAKLRGKNDIEVNGKKIAGLGLYQSEGGLLFHASLLAELDIELLLSLLRIPIAKLAAHGINGVADRITTLSREMSEPLVRSSVYDALTAAFEAVFGCVASNAIPSNSLLLRADELERSKYLSEDWLFDGGRSNSGEFSTEFRTEIGTLHLIVANQGEVIKSALVTGDFNWLPSELIGLEESLRWATIEESLLTRRIEQGMQVHKLLDPAGLARAICSSYRSGRPQSEPKRIGSCYIPEEINS